MDKIGFFEESAGVKSITRLITFIGIIWTLGTGSWFIYKDESILSITAYITSMTAIFSGLKLATSALTEKPQKEK